MSRSAWDYAIVLFLNGDGSQEIYIADMGAMMHIDESLGRLTISQIADVWAEVFARTDRSQAIAPPLSDE
jgi:hypothetical protein